MVEVPGWYPGHADPHGPVCCSPPSQNTEFHTCGSSTVLCKGEEEASIPSPESLQEQKRMCYSVKEVRPETFGEKIGCGHSKGSTEQSKRLVLILPQRLRPVIAGWLGLAQFQQK